MRGLLATMKICQLVRGLVAPKRDERSLPRDSAKGPRVKLVWLAFAAAACSVGVAQAQPPPPQVLLQNYKCYICHSNDESKTGPAYADVAARYRNNPRAVSILIATIKKGAHGAGPWHMPPHPEISDADAGKMARYILSLEK